MGMDSRLGSLFQPNCSMRGKKNNIRQQKEHTGNENFQGKKREKEDLLSQKRSFLTTLTQMMSKLGSTKEYIQEG